MFLALVVAAGLMAIALALSAPVVNPQLGGGGTPSLVGAEIDEMNLSGRPFAILAIDPGTGDVVYPGAGGGAQGPLEVGANEEFADVGEIYWDDTVDCVYLEHPRAGRPWSRGCASATPIVMLHISTVDGSILRLLPSGRIEGVADPELEATDEWGWAANSPGCVYYSFQGRMLKICD